MSSLFKQLSQYISKPEIYSRYTAETLWTQNHLASQMLAFHLSEETPLASRPVHQIKDITQSLHMKLNFTGKKICDLGCGPGLYTQELTKLGGQVTGIDISQNSINYARQIAEKQGLSVDYVVTNYLNDIKISKQDIITFLYFDLCVLSPCQRRKVYKNMKDILKSDGILVLEVLSAEFFEGIIQKSILEKNYMGGFWSPNAYVALHCTHRYEQEKVSLDHFVIIEDQKTYEIFNWFKYFDFQEIEHELAENGFRIQERLTPFDTDDDTTFAGNKSFALVAAHAKP